MNRILIACLLVFLMPNSGPSKADIKVALGRAEVYMEEALEFGVELYNIIAREGQKGKTDIDPKTWNEVIVPLGKKCSLRLEEAIKEIDAIRPKNFLRKPFWRRVYNDFYFDIGITADVMKDLSFYQSEYMQRIIGTDSLILMYLSILNGKLKNLEDDIDSIATIRSEMK